MCVELLQKGEVGVEFHALIDRIVLCKGIGFLVLIEDPCSQVEFIKSDINFSSEVAACKVTDTNILKGIELRLVEKFIVIKPIDECMDIAQMHHSVVGIFFTV